MSESAADDPADGLVGVPLPRFLSTRAAEVVSMAREVLERDGPEALTMRRLAGHLKMRAPSIYKHLAGKRAIEVALIEAALLEMGQALHSVIDGDVDGDSEGGARSAAIPHLLRVYRHRATAEPNLYRLATAGPLPRAELSPGLEDWAGEPFFRVTGESSLAQALWSYAHGMVSLEIDGRYPAASDLDRTWAAGTAAFQAACA